MTNAAIPLKYLMHRTVSGRVVDATTTLPIGSLVINADPDEQGGPGYGACTNADGYYTLIDLPLATDFKVRTGVADDWCGGPIDYVTEYWQEVPDWNSATTFNLTGGHRIGVAGYGLR